jgi:hypothetical protein
MQLSVKPIRKSLRFGFWQQSTITRRHLTRCDFVVDADPFRKIRVVNQVAVERVEAQAGLLNVRPVAVDAISFYKRFDPGAKRRRILAACHGRLDEREQN